MIAYSRLLLKCATHLSPSVRGNTPFATKQTSFYLLSFVQIEPLSGWRRNVLLYCQRRTTAMMQKCKKGEEYGNRSMLDCMCVVTFMFVMIVVSTEVCITR